jgi:hypothetical protein
MTEYFCRTTDLKMTAHIQVEWDNDDKRTIRYTFTQGWQWNELGDAFMAADELVSSVDYKVDVIMDFSPSSMLVPGNAISQSQRAFANPRNKNLRLTVLVGNRFITVLTNTVQKLLGSRGEKWELRFANTLADARQIVAEFQRKSEESNHA